jgi:hypothetical protein
MDNNMNNNQQTAAPADSTEATIALDRLLAQAHTKFEPGEFTVAEEWVKVGRSHCRVAVVISDYGTHIEVGSKRGTDSQITWTFREEDLAKARALLVEYENI